MGQDGAQDRQEEPQADHLRAKMVPKIGKKSPNRQVRVAGNTFWHPIFGVDPDVVVSGRLEFGCCYLISKWGC